MEDQWVIVTIPIVYVILLTIVLLPYIMRIGWKPIFCLMSAVHVFYLCGICVLALIVWKSYYLIKNTEFGQRIEKSIVVVNETKFLSDDSSVHRYIGEDVSFRCRIQVGHDEDNYFMEWTLNGKIVTADSNHRISDTGVNMSVIYQESILYIYNLRNGDFGLYACGSIRYDSVATELRSDKLCYLNDRYEITTFRLRRLSERTDVIFIPPGGILRFQIKFHALRADNLDTSVIYTINEKPITILDDRQLFTKCSFFIYNYWLLFEYGYLLSQLNTVMTTINDSHSQVLTADTNFCIKDEYFGTYKFFIQTRYFDSKTNRRKLSEVRYPVIFQVLPRRPGLFDSNYVSVIPSDLTVTNSTSRCWTEPSFNAEDFCGEMLELFKSIPFLFFAVEGIIFIPSFLLCSYCFIYYIYLLNWMFLKLFRDKFHLDSPFQVILQDGVHKSLSKDSRPAIQGSSQNNQICISYFDDDELEVNLIKDLVKNVLIQKGLEWTVRIKSDLSLGSSELSGPLEIIQSSSSFIIYGSNNYWKSNSLEIPIINETFSELSIDRLIILIPSDNKHQDRIAKPHLFCSWHDGLTQTAKKDLLTKWINHVAASKKTEVFNTCRP
ncbi:hypothetical protein SNE40_016521 [Patella caerulea]|uniref:Ig-like domain-containing protein n=1 Tax=Patella caerulea TaxID=87958 RepID=A0AAN8PJE4_PATCE